MRVTVAAQEGLEMTVAEPALRQRCGVGLIRQRVRAYVLVHASFRAQLINFEAYIVAKVGFHD